MSGTHQLKMSEEKEDRHYYETTTLWRYEKRKCKLCLQRREDKAAQETNTWPGEGGGDRNQGSPLRWHEAAELTQPVSGKIT